MKITRQKAQAELEAKLKAEEEALQAAIYKDLDRSPKRGSPSRERYSQREKAASPGDKIKARQDAEYARAAELLKQLQSIHKSPRVELSPKKNSSFSEAIAGITRNRHS